MYHRIGVEEMEQGTTPANPRVLWALAGDPSFLGIGPADHCRRSAIRAELRHRLLLECDSGIKRATLRFKDDGKCVASRRGEYA